VEGGRSSGKSQSIARLISYLCEQKRLRIVCGRETQNSIEESVYTIFADLVRRFKLNFDVSATKIDHRSSGSAIRFRGFREQGATNIMGLEGVDILWVEQAEAITKQTLEVIIPTIRKENSKIIFSMNRFIESDPVFVAMAGRPDCLHIHIDYLDNPFCPQKMIDEANLCKETNIDDYNHIWLGQPLKKSDDALYTTDEVYGSSKLEYLHSGTRKRVMGVDVARFGEDETVFSIIESYNVSQWHQIWQDTWKNKSTMETVGRIVELTKTWALDQVVIDDTGVGGGVTDRLGELRISVAAFVGAEKAVNELYVNKRSEAFFRLKDMFALKTMKILRDVALQTQLLSIRYKYISSGKKAIIGKDEMRKDGLNSPDRADALAMAVYYKDDSLNERDYEDRKQPSGYQMVDI
jgi:phage terminase large subunit